MSAIFKREFKAYFRTPLGYVIIAVAYFFTGYYFFTYNMYGATTDFNKLYSLLFSVVLFLIPVLTMRLMSEEIKSKTDQLLLTAPISRFSIIIGKYFSAACVFLIAIAGTLAAAVIASFYGKVDWPWVIAAVLGFAVSLFMLLVDALSYVVNSSLFKAIFEYISFNERYSPFTLGVIEFKNVIFFVSIAGLFLAFSTAVLERKRWN